MKYLKLLLSLWMILLLTACTTNQTETVELPKSTKKSLKSYKSEITKAILAKDLEFADKLYLDMRDQYIESDSVGGVMFQLAKAHMSAKEYLLSRYYCEAYIKDYPDGRRLSYAWFLRVESLFLRFKNGNSKQALVEQVEQELKMYRSYFGRNKYSSKIKKMTKEVERVKEEQNEKIALSYEKMGKPKAAEYYRSKLSKKSKKRSTHTPKATIKPSSPNDAFRMR
jgi:outer membrane protein assembly factor BamD